VICKILLSAILLLPAIAAAMGLLLAVKTGAWRDIGAWYARSTAVFLASIPMTLLGLPVVAIALPFRISDPNSVVPFTQYPGSWMFVRLPAWAQPWDNPVDGLLGDRRGWWNDYCVTNYGKACDAFYSMWQWAAIRNSANYWSRITVGLDASRCTAQLLAFGKRWQFLCATRDDGRKFYLLEGLVPYPNSTHALEFRFGQKIALDDNRDPAQPLADRMLGCVYRFRPWKAI